MAKQTSQDRIVEADTPITTETGAEAIYHSVPAKAPTKTPNVETVDDADALTFEVAGPLAATGAPPVAVNPDAPVAAADDPGTDLPTWSYTGTPAAPAHEVGKTPTVAAGAAPTPEPIAAAVGEVNPGRQPTPVSLGVVGRHRMPATVVVLSILTLGLYQLAWYARINREMSDFDTRMHVHSGRAVWAIVVPWGIGLLATLAGAAWLLAAPLHLVLPTWLPDSHLWALLPLAGLLLVPILIVLIPFSIVGAVMTAERVRICEDRVGITTDVQLRPVATVRWLLLPAVGGLVFAGRLQVRLNRVWERVAPPASNRRRR